MRNHSADLKNESAKCAACFFLEKSNSRPGIGLFIFEKSNRKLRRILFFRKVQFPRRNQTFYFWRMVSQFAPTIFAEDSCRNLRRMVFLEIAVAICAAWFFWRHQSQFAPHSFFWNTCSKLRRLYFVTHLPLFLWDTKKLPTRGGQRACEYNCCIYKITTEDQQQQEPYQPRWWCTQRSS